MDEQDKLVNIGKAAEILGVSIQTLRRWDELGVLKPVRVGLRQIRNYKKSDLDRILEEGMPEQKKTENPFKKSDS